jgi:purine-nucleoside phosphorylase
MEAAALLRVAELRGARAACALAVTDMPGASGEPERVGDDELERLGVSLGALGLAALTQEA